MAVIAVMAACAVVLTTAVMATTALSQQQFLFCSIAANGICGAE
jgi:hypothetical protein